ncbi:DUF3304 domain-containing protein [Massilia sp. SYSU DXS3249]
MKRYIKLISTLALLLVGCSKAVEMTESPKANTVSVSVHGVNYTADPFRYVLVDATDPSNGTGGGEHITSFGGGGTSCCFRLPERWRPGIQARVRSTHWLPEDDKGNLPEVEKVYDVEIPAYPTGKAGELWILRTADGGIELVMSNVEPDHPQWPGKVKGWPQPSLEYQRERWELHRGIAQSYVDSYRGSLEHLQKYAQAHLQNGWDFDKQHNRELVKKFSGPNDPAYAEYTRTSYVEGLRRSKERLEQLLKEKP